MYLNIMGLTTKVVHGLEEKETNNLIQFNTILHKIKRLTCFKDLLTLDKIFYKTYKEAALALGFIEDDEHIYKVFNEVCKIMLPYQLINFFFMLSFYSYRIIR